MLINSSYDIHYIEHDHKDLADEGTQDKRMKTKAKNKTVLYDKTKFDGQEWAYFAYAEKNGATTVRTRYFPAQIVSHMIDNYKTSNVPYDALKTTYEADCNTYKKAYEATKISLK